MLAQPAAHSNSMLGPATLERCISIGCVHHTCILCWHNLQCISTAHLVQPSSTHERGVLPLVVCATKAYSAGRTCSTFPQHTWLSHSALMKGVYFHWLCAPQRHTVLAQPAAHSNSTLGSAIQHSLKRCTSIGCVHHRGILCWHNLQRIPTAAWSSHSAHTGEVYFHSLCAPQMHTVLAQPAAYSNSTLGPATLERCISIGCVHHTCILCWHNLQCISTAHLVQPSSTHERGVLPLVVCATKAYSAGRTCSTFPQHTWLSHSALMKGVYFHWLCAPQRHTVLAQPAAHSNSTLGSAIQHSLKRCTSIGCVHHRGILCWHNLQRIPTAAWSSHSAHTGEVYFHSLCAPQMHTVLAQPAVHSNSTLGPASQHIHSRGGLPLIFQPLLWYAACHMYVSRA